MIKILIIEDERIAADHLEKILLSIDNSFQILKKIESVRESVNWLHDNQVDLIFLDIQLSDGISFSIFEQLDIKTPVIFTTAYDQYAIKAFKTNSVDYLLKPIDKQELEQSIIKYKELRFNKDNEINIKEIIQQLKNPVEYQTRFLIYAGQKIKTIKTTDIAYFYVSEKGVFICTRDDMHYAIDYTLEKLEEILDPVCFFRINRQFIIHIDSIENMFPYSKSRIKVELRPSSELEAIVSFSNAHLFKKWLNR
jgi:two-component system, LytTR family, response regulator LytT